MLLREVPKMSNLKNQLLLTFALIKGGVRVQCLKKEIKLIVQTRLVNAWETLNSNRPWGPFLKSPETFQVPQFFLYLRNAEVLSHQTSSSSWFFLQ